MTTICPGCGGPHDTAACEAEGAIMCDCCADIYAERDETA
jgi:hypothetical protein